jgi:hypothetical protein
MRRPGSRIVAALALHALVVVSTLLGAAELPTFAVTLTAGRIDPPRLEVPAKTRVKLTLRNAGGGAAEFEGRDVRVEKVLAPGAESFVVLPPLAPGTYRFFDDFHPDAPGVLIVVK